MDKMCNKSEAEDLDKSITNAEEPEILKRSESPVFKCVNAKSRAPDSSDYDIPSYQLNQSLKSRTSSKCENETNDFVLPFSPIFSPIPVSTVQFQPPSAHSLGTVVKNMEKGNITAKMTEEPCIFQTLGMTDKDISWVSSMASPPPKQLPGCEFNTIEKATFFPEQKFQNIQPRALFSQTSDFDIGCQPISSDSDDDDDEAYKSNIRLSDVCATLKQLEVKSLESDIKDNSIDLMSSPVIKMKKLENSKKKKQAILVKSPQDNYEFLIKDSILGKSKDESTLIEDDLFQSMSFTSLDELCKTVTEEAKKKPVSVKKKFYSSKSSDIYKVSSLDMLYSYAKALEEGNKIIINQRKVDKSIGDTNIVRLDKPEDLKVDATKRSHSEVWDVQNESKEKKMKVVDDGWENMKEYLSESQLNVSDGEIFRTLENLEKTLASQESRDSKLSGEASQEKNKNEQKSNPSDICQETNYKTKSPTFWKPQVAFVTASGTEISVSEKSLAKARQILKECDDNKLKGFSTMSGKLIQVSDKSLEKAKALMSECEAEISSKSFPTKIEKFSKIQVSAEALEKAKALMEDCNKSVEDQELSKTKSKIYDSRKLNFQGFSAGSGKKIQDSTKALEKSKALIGECEEFGSFKPDESNCLAEFSIGSGKQAQASEESLTKDRCLMEDSDKNVKHQIFGFCQPKEKANKVCFEAVGEGETGNLSKFSFQGFTTGSGKQVKVSDEALKKAKALMEDCDNNAINEAFEMVKPEESNNLSFQGFTTGSGKQVKVSDEALKKAKALMEDCGKNVMCDDAIEPVKLEKLNDLSFQGFTTGSGKQVKVSDEALKKAKSLMAGCYDESSTDKVSSDVEEGKLVETKKQTLLGFSTGSGKPIQVSEESLDKAKSKMKHESTEELASIWMGELVNESFHEMKTPEKGEQSENFFNAKNTKVEADKNGVEVPGIATEGDDWDEIIPSWLHVYNTSPSMASDRLELTPLVSHENGNTSSLERQYIKSPVLSASDRFYGKTKKRKLDFTEKPTSYGSVRETMKRTSKLLLDFSAPFKKAKFEKVEATGVNVKAERERAREQQERTIKKKEKVKPLKGLLLSRKCLEKRINWVEATKGSSPEVYSEESLRRMGVREEVLGVRIENAVDFRFKGEDFFEPKYVYNVEGMPIGDGCMVILDDENQFGVEEMRRAFLAAPGVQPNLLPSGWVENHYKWIVWKFAHYEKSFPRYFAGRCLTPNNVMLQLKYRYDREIDRNERSALKKILERDDTAARRMVLCVCGIKKVSMGETSGYELNLTDGWYSCPARVDAAMSRVIEEGKVFVGLKLLTQGATIVNCEQGVSPLEIGGDVYLKISTNSTRRVRWDTKLGFQKNPENFLISLGSVLPQGGTISRLDVIIVRVYPVLFMEKTSDGHHVTRNRRSEEKTEAEYRRIQEQRMEKIWDEVRQEMRSVLEKNRSLDTRTQQEEGLSQLTGGCSNLIVLRSNLTEDNRFGREFTDRVEEKLKSEKLDKRNVSAFLRAKIVDFRKPDYNNTALLSVWNPNEDLIELLTEGKVFSVMNISISNSSRVYKTLQINTTRQTQFRPISRIVKYPARKLTRLIDVPTKVCPAFEEVDVVGMVALIRDVSFGSRLSQIIYLTDVDFHFVGLVFWGSCRDYGWETVLKIRSIVACSNLQWKKTVNPNEIPSLHVSENSVFTENPRHGYLKEEIVRLKEAIPKDLSDFLSKCEEELTVKLEESKWGANRSLDNSKSYFSNEFGSKPTASSTPIKALPVRISSRTCAEPSPIQKRIEKLQSYGEPPPLIPLIVTNRKIKKKS